MLSTVWAGTLVNYPHEMGKCVERDFKKLKLKAASHNTTSWYTDTDWFLEHSPSGGDLYYKGPTLQKIILVFGGSLLVYMQYYYYSDLKKKEILSHVTIWMNNLKDTMLSEISQSQENHIIPSM